jgi:hypothetical protein
MNLDLGNTLFRAWKITWHNKALWFFGFLAALASGGGSWNGGSRSSFNLPSSPSGYPRGVLPIPPQVGRWLDRLQQAGPTIIAIFLGVICVLLLLGLVIFLLALIGRGGLIGGAHLADANGHVTFGQAWGVGVHCLGRLFLINLPAWLLGLIIVLAFAAGLGVVALSLARAGAQGAMGMVLGVLACVVPVMCILVLLGILLAILIHFTQLAAVLEDLTPRAAYGRAWAVIKANIAPILILGIILLVIGAIFGIIIGLPALLIVAPLIVGIVGGAATRQGAPIAAGVAFALLCCGVYVPIALVLRSIFETWVLSAWTLAYQQFIGNTAASASPVVPASSAGTFPVVPSNPPN